MKPEEVSELFEEISSKCLKEPKKGLSNHIVPPSSIPDDYSEGSQLRFDLSIIDESSRNCIKSIVEKHKLKMMKLKGYLVIYTPRKT